MTAFPEDMFKTQKADLGIINKTTRLRKDINVFINGLCDGEIKYNEYIAVKEFIDISSYILFPERYEKMNKGLSYSNSFFLTLSAFEKCDEFKVENIENVKETKPCFKKLFYDLDNFSNSDSKNRLIKFLLTLDEELEELIKMELNR